MYEAASGKQSTSKGDLSTIKLNVCSKCNNTVDKYIEYDNFILFIDILLLNAGAFRHLIFNVLEDEEVYYRHVSEHQCADTGGGAGAGAGTGEDHRTKSKLWRAVRRHRKFLRLYTVCVLFEVYLSWAYEERNLPLDVLEAVRGRHSVGSAVGAGYVRVYLLYLARCVAGSAVMQVLVAAVVVAFYGHSGHAPPAGWQSVGMVVVVTQAVKLLPVVMLIWPYESQVPVQIVRCLGNCYTVEGLRIVLGCPRTVAAAAVVLALSTKMLLRFLCG
ncbi:sterol homeostasis protein ARV1 [Ascoidea rubescens DSM 1968]|uniref:Protein ARV n=1 Tax=Ascoidea rubescens DSM 1968 TaxID=1344418 RepID=A0A1D2VDL9_9ASCO|nr:Arv1-domain-containing protein [Ascoidea rubescens DSM 1968]ODV59741.1 Arv1-domain-containing protein [Ascoidea rubescens DSM 1968]